MTRPRPDSVIVGIALAVTAGTALAIPAIFEPSHVRILALVDALALLVLLVLLAKLRADRSALLAARDARLLADAAGDLVMRLDPAGAIRFASPAARGLCGREPRTLVGTALEDLVVAEDRPALRDVLAALTPGGDPRRVHLRLTRPGRDGRWVEMSARMVAGPRGAREVHVAARDDTTRREAEMRIRRERDTAEALAGRLRESRAAAEAHNEQLRALLAERAVAQLRRETILRIGQRLSGETAPAAIARAVLDGAEDLAGATAGAVYALGEWGRPLRCIAHRGLPAPPPSEVSIVVDDDGPYPVTARPGEPVARPGGPPVLMLPLRRGNFLVGALWIAGPDLCPDGTRRRELVHLAGQAAVSLDTARAFQAAVRQAEILRAVLDADPDAIHLVDPAGGTLMTNRPFRALGDARVAVGPGRRGGTVRDEDARMAGRAPAGGGDRRRGRDYVLDGDGRSLVRLAAPVRDEHGGMLGTVFIHRDVTVEREADRLKDEFLALVSHELRTPLTSVLGYTEMLLEGELGPMPADQERAVGVVERNALRLQRLVGDLLVVAQAQAGRLSVIRERVDLAALARERLLAFGPLAAEAGVRLDARVADGAAWLDGDRERLGQVVDNLLGNALTHTPPGGAVTLSLVREAGDWALRVADTGPGIPTSDRERVFESFRRGTGAAPGGGVGLGLAISRAIADAHGGDLRVEDAPRGAVLRLTLPAAGAGVRGPIPASPIAAGVP